jgi:hypothetical protein
MINGKFVCGLGLCASCRHSNKSKADNQERRRKPHHSKVRYPLQIEDSDYGRCHKK